MAGVPGVTITERDLSAYVPVASSAIVAMVGAATKGPTDTIEAYTDEGNFVDRQGKPINGMHGMRAAIRYLKKGSSLRFTRIAGTLLATATVGINDVSGASLILTVSASSDGTWANSNLQVGITHNGTASYNLFVYSENRLVEQYTNLTNGTIETIINGISPNITVAVDSLAGATFPDSTLNTQTEEIDRLSLVGGNDGAFASTLSSDSIMGGIASRDLWTETIVYVPAVTTQTFQATAPVQPGSFTSTTGAVTGTDDGDGTITGAGITSGYIDYATGAVTIVYSVAPTADIDISYRYGTIEESAVTAPNQLVYAGSVARPGIQSNSFRVLTPREDQIGIGTGVSALFEETLQGGDIERGTLNLTAAKSTGEVMTVTDDSNGTLVGNVPIPTVATEKVDFSAGTSPAPGFAVGEVLTQAVSLATATVLEVVSGDVYIIDRTSVAAFDTVNGVTGSLGGGGSTPGIPGAIPTAMNVIDYATGVLSLFFIAPVGSSEIVTGRYQQHASDDAAGVVTGGNISAGTIAFATGTYSLTYTFVPSGNYLPNFPDGLPFQFQYGHITVLGVGDGLQTLFVGTMAEVPIKPGTVLIEAGGVFVADDGAGNLIGAAGSGTIDYWTGAISFTFTVAPAIGIEVNVNADVILANIEATKAGPDANRATILTDGFHVIWDASPSVAGNYRLRVLWNSGTGAAVIEEFDQIRDIAHAFEVINGIGLNAGSNYILLSPTGFSGVANSATQNIGLAGAFTAANVIGTEVGVTKTGMQLYKEPEKVPVDWLSAPGLAHRSITTAGINLCETLGRRCIWIISLPDFEDWRDADDYANGSYNSALPGGVARPTPDVMNPPLTAINSEYATAVFAWVQYFDAFAEVDVWEPPEGDVLARVAFVDSTTEPWFTIAGVRRGNFEGVLNVRYSPDRNERAQMYGVFGGITHIINPIVRFIGQGIYLYGQRTAQRNASVTDRINIRWALNIVENQIEIVSRSFPFEQGDGILFREITSTISRILEPIKSNRGLHDFRVVCDETINTPELLEQNRVRCKVFVQWIKAGESIEYEIVLTPQGIDLSSIPTTA